MGYTPAEQLGRASHALKNDEEGRLFRTASFMGGMGEDSVVFCIDTAVKKEVWQKGRRIFLVVVEKRDPNWCV